MSKFIVLEGIDGSGKTTLANFLREELSDDSMIFTREPSNSNAGELAKKIANENTSPYYDLFIYLADRAAHISFIEKELNKGNSVISDRYWGSTVAYQAASEEISFNYLEKIHQPFILKPNLTVLLDIKPETALERINTNRDNKSKYEKVSFLQKVRSNYLKLAERYNWITINAEKSLPQVKSEIKQTIEECLSPKE